VLDGEERRLDPELQVPYLIFIQPSHRSPFLVELNRPQLRSVYNRIFFSWPEEACRASRLRLCYVLSDRFAFRSHGLRC
jgi:hypothetical protein